MNFWQILFIIIAFIVIVFYTLFAPEAFFHNTYRKKENPKLFDRWEDKRLAWNIHQSFIHFIGSSVGFVSLYILFFYVGVDNPKDYGVTHLILFLLGISGIMGFIPRIFFGSTISK